MIRKKILLVDNDSSNQEILTRLLTPEYECISVQNNSDGLSYLERNPGEIDLIIVNFILPVMNGVQMLKGIQKDSLHKNIPVLAEISPEQPESITRAFDAGADDILSKPLSPDITKKRISNMLSLGNGRKVHNIMEDVVELEINENISNLGICTCPICRKDLLTLTLNNVKPKYVSSEKGKIITRAVSLVSREENTKLLAELTHYAQKIKANPNHS